VRGVWSGVIILAMAAQSLAGCANLGLSEAAAPEPAPQDACAAPSPSPAEPPASDEVGIDWTPPLTLADGAAAYKRGDYQLALAAWQPLANKGDAMAENGIGVLYEYGFAVREDANWASQWLRKAVAQGNAQAADNLGWMYERGFGVKADPVCAYMWYSLAAALAHGDDAKVPKINLERIASSLAEPDASRARELAAACQKSNFEACS
jgi:TPR repeat protein